MVWNILKYYDLPLSQFKSSIPRVYCTLMRCVCDDFPLMLSSVLLRLGYRASSFQFATAINNSFRPSQRTRNHATLRWFWMRCCCGYWTLASDRPEENQQKNHEHEMTDTKFEKAHDQNWGYIYMCVVADVLLMDTRFIYEQQQMCTMFWLYVRERCYTARGHTAIK